MHIMQQAVDAEQIEPMPSLRRRHLLLGSGHLRLMQHALRYLFRGPPDAMPELPGEPRWHHLQSLQRSVPKRDKVSRKELHDSDQRSPYYHQYHCESGKRSYVNLSIHNQHRSVLFCEHRSRDDDQSYYLRHAPAESPLLQQWSLSAGGNFLRVRFGQEYRRNVVFRPALPGANCASR